MPDKSKWYLLFLPATCPHHWDTEQYKSIDCWGKNWLFQWKRVKHNGRPLNLETHLHVNSPLTPSQTIWNNHQHCREVRTLPQIPILLNFRPEGPSLLSNRPTFPPPRPSFPIRKGPLWRPCEMNVCRLCPHPCPDHRPFTGHFGDPHPRGLWIEWNCRPRYNAARKWHLNGGCRCTSP